MVANAQHPCGSMSQSKLKHETALECRLKKAIDNGTVAINERVEELHSEWTSGRAAKVTTGMLVVAGLILSLTMSLWWLIVPIIGGALLFQYVFSKTSLVSAIFRRMGFRSGAEIEEEMIALRVLRGDFASLPTVHTIEDREAVSRMEGEGGPAPSYDEEPKQDAHSAVKDLIGAIRA